MRISIVSQNLAEATDVNFDLSHFLENNISGNPDIYVEMSQEDGRLVNNESLVDGSILEENNFKLLIKDSINGKRTKQNIITSIFIKNHLNAKVLAKGHIAVPPQPDIWGKLKYTGSFISSFLPNKLGYTKGLLYIKINIKNQNILFLNMHLPVITKSKNGHPDDITLGFDYRKNVFEKLLIKMMKLKLIDSTTTVLIGGDLNFRQDKNGIDQLNVLLREKNGYKTTLTRKLKELSFPKDSHKRITCKFRNPNKACRTRNMPTGALLANYISKVQKDCGDKHRIPSRCDRILIMSPNSINVNYYRSKFLQQNSDHNAVLASIDITPKY
jgi:endonuclease/exonuclease/phosphatase family metal-dependent hydrolase